MSEGSKFTRRLRVSIHPSSTAFPEARSRTGRARDRWLSSYAKRLLAKDSTDIIGIQYPVRLAALLNVIAARNAGEFVAARAGREIDVPERSIPAYLQALRSVFLIRVIPGWSDNIANRAVSSPKGALTDTGLAAHHSGVDVDGLETAVSSPLVGGLVEGFVVGIEVKSSAGPRAGDFKGLQYLRARLGERFVAGIVLHTGERSLPFGDRLWALPISTLWTK